MIDRICLAALTFCFLAFGTLAIGSAFFETGTNKATPQTAAAPIHTLDRVVVVGKRIAAPSAPAGTLLSAKLARAS